MESLIVSPLLELVCDNLASHVSGRVRAHRDFKAEAKKLQDTLQMIQAVMEDAEQRQLKDKKIRVWLSMLRDVAYDADDLLEEFRTQALRKECLKRRHNRNIRMKFMTKVRLTYLSLESVPSSLRMPWKLRKIRERLDDIAKDMNSFHFKEATAYDDTESRDKRETGPCMDESQVYGRNDDLNMILDMLLRSNSGGSSSLDPSVLAIVGIGGIGKTTLAQLVYNDERVTKHFDLKLWISVYDNFNVKKLTVEMLDYATNYRVESSQLGILQSQLREALCGKRYLLVLDDVWNEDQDQWEILKNPLCGSADGSKILVTTRSHKVAAVVGANSTYNLEGLAEDDCWTLFRRRAFADGEELQYPFVFPIGKQIVKKCKGVPLAAKILGSLMRFTREEREWLHVQGSELWDLDDGENRLLSVLRLSYNHLPSHLKRCFSYCSLHPKGYEINKQKLVRLWAAERLIASEHRGHVYFNDLLQMSLFHQVSSTEHSMRVEYKMHDLIHDLAKSIAGDEFLTLGHNSLLGGFGKSQDLKAASNNLMQIRHAVVDCNFKTSLIPETLYKANKLRTLNLLSPVDDYGQILPAVISAFRHLRVLNLSGCELEKLHRSIGGLIYLRYLDLSNTLIETLAATVGQLCNLQTLDLSGCNNLRMLPSEVTDLMNLKHLNIKNCGRLAHLPEHIGKLWKLRTLPLFIVRHPEGEDLEGLGYLFLEGELSIKCLAIVQKKIDKLPANLLLYQGLESLKLSWGNDNEGKSEHYSFDQIVGGQLSADSVVLLEKLQPNKNISRLSIKDYPGLTFPQWMMHPESCNQNPSFQNLKELVLINCRRCTSVPTLGKLPSLEYLSIQGIDTVENIGQEFYGEGNAAFSSLKQLTLKDLGILKAWERADTMEAFPCLSRLTIIKCPSLTTMPWFPSLQHLEFRNCSPMLLKSAAELSSLSTLVIDVFPELAYLPPGLLQNNASLTALTISSCPQLSSLPWDLTKLEALKSLTIRWCEQLSMLPQGIKHLTSLESLEIIECPSLVTLPEEGMKGLQSLCSLSIENCSSLSSLPVGIKYLSALEHLAIMYCPNLTCIPDNLQHLSTLRSLNILSCPELVVLPEGLRHVTSLQNLEIRSCQNLKELPEWLSSLILLRSLAVSDCPSIKSLPDGLKHLSALQHLSIRDCPDLEKQCEKGTGEEWYKLSHIPYVYIGSSPS
ncbi:hypothetical protein SLA2020_514220 [Shorea laevis]